MSERIWMILAAFLLIVAAVFLWGGNLSAAFVIATLGAVAWFLSYRSQLRAKIPIEEEPELVDEERDED
jgi:Flp pilus assembly protein TadB